MRWCHVDPSGKRDAAPLETDAADRLDELDGIEFEDLAEYEEPEDAAHDPV